MGKPTGFLEFRRREPPLRPVHERVRDWREVLAGFSPHETREQAARCMDCGVPTCHAGCPLGNVIPDWNDLVHRGRWRTALDRLHGTNNFPEFTGLTCPAPCEPACVLALDEAPVTIRQIEWEIVRHGWEAGWIHPHVPMPPTGRSVGVVGSGPAGLAAAQQLRRGGHEVVVYEKDDRIGGLLVYGIPDFKLEKWIVDRRLDQLRKEGVVFRPRTHVGITHSAHDLLLVHDALLLCIGAGAPKDLPVPGRELAGVHRALDFLVQQNRRNRGDAIPEDEEILATGRDVVIIGGGDTASDCVGIAHRQRARSVTTLQLWPQPPQRHNPHTPWPEWPLVLRTSSSHAEGGVRQWAVRTKRLLGGDGRVCGVVTVRLRAGPLGRDGRARVEDVPGSERVLPADLVLIATGYAHPVHRGVVRELELSLDERGNVAADPERFATSEPGVFAAGDCRRGQSLLVWAIAEGREAARAVDAWLVGRPRLPARDRAF